jgi:hypothetical protein
MGKQQKKKKFDPEGTGYDYEGAKKAGLKKVRGHYESRDPKTGMLMKGRRHPTWHKTVKAEHDMGMDIYKGKDGRYYSRKRADKRIKNRR